MAEKCGGSHHIISSATPSIMLLSAMLHYYSPHFPFPTRRLPDGLEARLTELCSELRRALFPAYSSVCLQYCLDLIASLASTAAAAAPPPTTQGKLPGAAATAATKTGIRLQAAALLMIKCLFGGPEAADTFCYWEQQHGGGDGEGGRALPPGAAGLMASEPMLLVPLLALLQSPSTTLAAAAQVWKSVTIR